MTVSKFSIPICALLVLAAGVAMGQNTFTVANSDTTHRTMSVALSTNPVSHGIDGHAYNAYVSALLLEQVGDYWGAAENYKLALSYYPDSYEIGYSLAELYFRMRDPQKALDQLKAVKPVDANYYRLQAACYQALGDLERAKEANLRLVQLDPDDEQAFAFLATAYRGRQDLDSTVWAYEHLAPIEPDNYRILNEIGKLQAESGKVDKAKEAFQKSLAINKTTENITAYSGLGELYTVGKQFDSAEISLTQGLAVDSANILLHRQLVNLYVEEDSFNLALVHARKVVELSPLDRPSVRRLGLIYFRLDSLKQADSIFSDLIQGGEQTPLNHYYLGHVALRQRNFEKARTEFQMVADVEDTAAQSWLDLGYVFNQMKQPDREIEVYTKGLAHVHDSTGTAQLDFAMASAMERSGRWDDAVAAFEKLIAENPNHHQALNYLGYMYADKGVKLDYAKELLERALALAPDNPAYLDSYGWIYYRLGNFDKAVEYLQKAAGLVSDPTIFEHLGDAYKAAGKDDDARSWWLKASELDPNSIALKEKLEK